METKREITCSVCLGTGKGRKRHAGKPCPACNGTGKVEDRRRPPKTVAAGLLVLGLLALGAIAQAREGHIHPERWYQERWCARAGGEVEHRLPDGARVDCLTESEAVEVDFGAKWAEGLGQALYYGAATGRRPGVVLILEYPDDVRYLERLLAAIRAHGLPVDVWVVRP